MGGDGSAKLAELTVDGARVWARCAKVRKTGGLPATVSAAAAAAAAAME